MEKIKDLLAEAAHAGREGWSFEVWWLKSVCSSRTRQGFIRHPIWLACKSAHQAEAQPAADLAREHG